MIDFRKIKQTLTSEGRSELCTLFEEQALPNLSSNIEALKDEHPSDSLIKILWNFSQLHTETLPLTFVASSMLDLVQNEDILNKHPKTSFLICKNLYKKLIDNGELRSAIFLIKDFILSSSPDYFYSSDEFNDLKSDLLETLKRESLGATKRRENSSYIKTLDEIKLSISKAKPIKVKINDFNRLEPEEKKSSSEEFVLEKIKTQESLETQRNFVNTPNKDILPDENFKSNSNNSIFAKIAYFSILCLIICGIFYLLFEKKLNLSFSSFNFKSKAENNKIIYETNLDSEILSPQRTLPKAFSLDAIGPNLDDINKRLSKLGNQKDSSKTNENEETQAPKQTDDSEIESLNTVPDKSDTADSNSSIKSDNANNPTVPKLPSMPNMGSPLDLGTTTQSGNRPKGTAIDPNKIKTSPEGRSYGPPEVQDPTKGKGNQQALDGSILKSYEVERFDPPLVYETITATNVLAAPSLMSQTVTRLVSDTPVHVTAKMGLWLELRSNEGKVGYIFAQDAIRKD